MASQNVDDRKSKKLPSLLKPRVLVVDEDLDDLRYYSAVLQRHGLEVDSIPSYLDGAECLARKNFDLIIVSQGSTNFEGRRVLARAIEINRHTPVFVVTRSVEMSCYLEAIQSGALDYIEKPLLPSQIADLVARSIRTHLGTASSSANA
jgi:DNA-binding NtrC family response regulator